ncbi:hypothetical protein PRIPAC_74968 [Pristionchus pacificus]|uniref:G protein-coupled receptor n=1 Tax=Pristionchus pacificus TaxID=54126 RepID=A0A2A6BF46_PRIPA|nr:hypothetical protein PRIPAC_74968 [Pristionchus pacificus]|eukprot:PDM64512.1 G protein-coupled receptor [Pristionchus pacificus]
MKQPFIEGNATSLPFNFHWDRDFAFSYVHTFQTWYPIFTLLTVHPLIFYVLLVRTNGYGRAVKWGYVVNQISLLAHELNVSFLFRMVNLAPYAGLYCDGPLCRMGLPKWMLMSVNQIPLSFTTICVITPFQFLLFRMHGMIVANSNTRIRFSDRTQTIIIIGESVLLLTNVFGFSYFGRDSDSSAQLLKRPELEWLTHREGTIFMFGPPGYPQYFMYEGLILFGCIALIAPFVGFLIIHSTNELSKRVAKGQSSSKTQNMTNSVIAVFFSQMIAILVLYISPLGILLIYLAVDLSFLPAPIIAFIRYLNMPIFLLEPLFLSLIFLLRNPNRRILIIAFLKTFCGHVLRSSAIEIKSTLPGINGRPQTKSS